MIVWHSDVAHLQDWGTVLEENLLASETAAFIRDTSEAVTLQAKHPVFMPRHGSEVDE